MWIVVSCLFQISFNRDAIRNAITGYSVKGYSKLEFRIGLKDRSTTATVCSEGFRRICDLARASFYRRIREIKEGSINCGGSLSDRSKVDNAIIAQARATVLWDPNTNKPSGLSLTLDQKAYMCLPNSPIQITAFGWLRDYFATIGDYQPNASEEIHLDPIEKLAVYREYVRELYLGIDMATTDCTSHLGYSAFVELWDRCFS